MLPPTPATAPALAYVLALGATGVTATGGLVAIVLLPGADPLAGAAVTALASVASTSVGALAALGMLARRTHSP